ISKTVAAPTAPPPSIQNPPYAQTTIPPKKPTTNAPAPAVVCFVCPIGSYTGRPYPSFLTRSLQKRRLTAAVHRAVHGVVCKPIGVFVLFAWYVHKGDIR